jgi:hypothetical protein
MGFAAPSRLVQGAHSSAARLYPSYASCPSPGSVQPELTIRGADLGRLEALRTYRYNPHGMPIIFQKYHNHAR